MKFKELKQKSKNELEMMFKENREKLRGLRFDLASRKLKNVRQINVLKKEIARILTILNSAK